VPHTDGFTCKEVLFRGHFALLAFKQQWVMTGWPYFEKLV
jgi:hypothetical protein